MKSLSEGKRTTRKLEDTVVGDQFDKIMTRYEGLHCSSVCSIGKFHLDLSIVSLVAILRDWVCDHWAHQCPTYHESSHQERLWIPPSAHPLARFAPSWGAHLVSQGRGPTRPDETLCHQQLTFGVTSEGFFCGNLQKHGFVHRERVRNFCRNFPEISGKLEFSK